MDTNTIITYLACIVLLFVFGRLFAAPIIKILKLIINSGLGAILIYIINIVGGFFSFHIGINTITALFVGILGIPGLILLVILKMFL